MRRYDFIIAGGGMAGLSLAYYLNQSVLRNKSILIIDKAEKKTNDRTWCFWERGERNPFEAIVYRKWQVVDFYEPTFSAQLHLGDYWYKMIRGIDFYTFVLTDLLQNPNIEFVAQTIHRITNTPQGAFVIAGDEATTYIADYVFDSTYTLKLTDPHRHNLLQHFKGWEIETDQPVFDVNRATLMDFRVFQDNDSRFFYILPLSPTRALVEYTLFSDKLLPPEAYVDQLTHYLQHTIGLTGYTILHEEFGVIPMTDEPTPERVGKRIIRIGTAGGYTKASTGYTFVRTQRFTQEIVGNLLTIGKPLKKRSLFRRRHRLYDSILLNVLANHRYPGSEVFAQLFRRNEPAQVLAFLDEDTTFQEELKIMSTVPLGQFTVAALDVFRKRVLSLI
ncbi:lycopene cyclase family protein [Nibrella viscosa]|uniref:Lycopene cyclase family protein n=1 Tax=Nibrella viscosa TaxID=1084524 RepID=A0ABP8K4W7_9BACT